MLEYFSLHYFAVASLAAYVLSAVLFLLGILGVKTNLNKAGRFILFGALILQTILILPLIETYNASTLENSGEYFFWFAWFISFSYLTAGKHSDYPLIGAFVSPLAAFFLSASSYLSHKEQSDIANTSNVLLLHIVPAFISELCLVFSLVISSVYLVQAKRIKKKLSSAITTPSPSLVMLESLNHRTLLLGFFSMTAAIISGIVLSVSGGSAIVFKDLYQWIAIFAWLVIAILLHGRTNLNWSSMRVARLTVYLALLVIGAMTALVFIQGNIIHEI